MDHLLKSKKFKDPGISKYVCQNKLKKTCFLRDDMVYGDFKYLPRRRTSQKVLRDKAFNISKDTKYDRYQNHYANHFQNFLNKMIFFFWKKIFGADLVGMPLISKYNKGIQFILCVVVIYSQYEWVVPL